MTRVLLVFFAVFAFAARSDGVLKCYMCDTLSNPSCGDPRKEGSPPPVPCDIPTMTNWHMEMSKNRDFNNIASLFEFDPPQYNTQLTGVACAKMNLKIGSTNVTLRNCQPAKTPTVDPCPAMREKLDKFPVKSESMSYCGLCYTDGCNGAVDVAAPKIIQLLLGSLGLMLFQVFRQHFV